jgi:dihydrodipicolinate synthase/N-acetylneuraminate lyase
MPSVFESARGLRGIIPPLVTPLSGQDSLDVDGFERLINLTISGGVHGIFVLGTTGEGVSLSRELRLEVARRACQWAGGRVPVLVGITDGAYAESIRLGEAAAEAGAAAVVAAPPYYFRYSQEDLLFYVKQLARELPLPLVLYNMPQFTKVEYSVDMVQRASDIPNVIALKDSSGDLAYLDQVIRSVRHRPDFGVFIGPEEHLVDGLRAGGRGGVCGGANLFPRLYVDTYEAVQRGEWAEAERLQKIIQQVSGALYRIGDPDSSYLRGLKTAVSVEGICSDLPALPFTRFTAKERKFLEKGLEDIRAAVDDKAGLLRTLSS